MTVQQPARSSGCHRPERYCGQCSGRREKLHLLQPRDSKQIGELENRKENCRGTTTNRDQRQPMMVPLLPQCVGISLVINASQDSVALGQEGAQKWETSKFLWGILDVVYGCGSLLRRNQG